MLCVFLKRTTVAFFLCKRYFIRLNWNKKIQSLPLHASWRKMMMLGCLTCHSFYESIIHSLLHITSQPPWSFSHLKFFPLFNVLIITVITMMMRLIMISMIAYFYYCSIDTNVHVFFGAGENKSIEWAQIMMIVGRHLHWNMEQRLCNYYTGRGRNELKQKSKGMAQKWKWRYFLET